MGLGLGGLGLELGFGLSKGAASDGAEAQDKSAVEVSREGGLMEVISGISASDFSSFSCRVSVEEGEASAMTLRGPLGRRVGYAIDGARRQSTP